MFKDFILGTTYIARGCIAFYSDKKTWRYAVWPMLIMFVFYVLAIWGISHVFYIGIERLEEAMQQLPSWLSWLNTVVAWVMPMLLFFFVIYFLSVTLCAFYEFFGGLFFDSLTEYYEKTKFSIQPGNSGIKKGLKYGWDSFCFGIQTILIFCIMFIVSLLVPIVGQILFVAVMGYYCGISYLISSANNNNLTIRQLKKICEKRLALISGFGIASYLLLCIPFVTVFMLPGLVLGGSELFHTQLKKELG